MFGRLTLNPVAHFDPLGGVLLVATVFLSGGSFGFGWAKPTPVNPLNLEGGRRGDAIVALAGPVSNFVLAAAAAIPLRFILANGELSNDVPMLASTLLYFVNINLVLMVFNLLPIPPLDGSKVLFAALDRETEWRVRPFLEQYGFIILFILILPILPGGSLLGRILLPIIDGLRGLLVGI